MASATRTAPNQQANPASQIGALWGLPGVTRPTEQPENNDGISVTLNQSNQTDFIFPANFKQTDVVRWWTLEFAISQTYTAGSSLISQSHYFPYSWVSQVALNMQNQFDTNNFVYGGIDAFLFNVLRPMRESNLDIYFLDQNPAINAYNTQPNLQSSAGYNTGSATVKMNLDLAPSIPFDRYFECDPKGRPITNMPIRTIVSPQYMAGTNRIIQPRVKMSAASGATLDVAPANIGSGSGTFSGSATLGIQRVGYYQPQSALDSPRVFNWQYRRQAYKYTQSGVSSADIPFPLNGQILGVFARFFDPSANGGLGAPIPINNIKNCYIQYGSGLYRYQDNPLRTQRRFAQERGLILPEGVLFWDFSWDEFGMCSNGGALNTMDTSGIQIHIDYTGAQSSTAYVVLGVEALTYIAML